MGTPGALLRIQEVHLGTQRVLAGSQRALSETKEALYETQEALSGMQGVPLLLFVKVSSILFDG